MAAMRPLSPPILTSSCAASICALSSDMAPLPPHPHLVLRRLHLRLEQRDGGHEGADDARHRVARGEGRRLGEVRQAALLLLERREEVGHVAEAQRVDGELDAACVHPRPKAEDGLARHEAAAARRSRRAGGGRHDGVHLRVARAARRVKGGGGGCSCGGRSWGRSLVVVVVVIATLLVVVLLIVVVSRGLVRVGHGLRGLPDRQLGEGAPRREATRQRCSDGRLECSGGLIRVLAVAGGLGGGGRGSPRCERIENVRVAAIVVVAARAGRWRLARRRLVERERQAALLAVDGREERVDEGLRGEAGLVETGQHGTALLPSSCLTCSSADAGVSDT